ncbi:hypothetical protein BS17DRAFT_769903 [Gyrodon lividus]|nr:hypothetical protein BS17DRAFT_769903 [Gyrodon lividus]
MFFLSMIQATTALARKPSGARENTEQRWMLLGCVWIMFTLATVGFSANSKYTVMVWTDLRDAPGGPVALINEELDYRINRGLALASRGVDFVGECEENDTSFYQLEQLMEEVLHLHASYNQWSLRMIIRHYCRYTLCVCAIPSFADI